MATVLMVAVAIGAAVVAWTWLQSMQAGMQASAEEGVSATAQLPVQVVAAGMTTPYTWYAVVRNPNDENLDIRSIVSFVKDERGVVCARSLGYVADSNVIPARGVEKITFYGWNDCEIPGTKQQWSVYVSPAKGFVGSATMPVSSLTMGLVLWMPMDDVWKFDKSGNDLDVHYYDDEFQGTLNGVHNGVLEGNPKWVNGRFGKALEFNANQDVNIGNVLNDVFVSRTFSICLWDYLNSYKNEYKNAAGMIIDKWHTSGSQDNAFILYTTGFTGNTGYLHYTQPLKQWNHICIVSKGGDVNIYVNGMLNASGSGFEYNSTTYPLLIGNSWNRHYDLNGKVDDVRIYDRALTDQEVKELYEGKDVRDGLVLYLPFDEGTGTTAWDWHNWSEEGLWLDGLYDGTTDNHVTNIYGLPSTITTPYTMVAEANVSKPNDALITRTTAHSAIWLGSENYRPCIHVDYNYNDGVDPLDLCINDLNMFHKDCRLAAEYTPPNGPAKICASCGGAVECNSVSTYDYGNPDLAQNTAGATIGAIWRRDLVDNTRGFIREVRYYSRALSEKELRCVVSNPNCLTDDKNLVVMYTFQEPCRSGPTDLSTNKVCRAPRIVEVNGIRGVIFDNNTTPHYFWTDADKGKLSGDFTVFAAFDTNNTKRAYIIRRNSDTEGFYNYFIHTFGGKLRAGIWDGSNLPDIWGTKIVNDAKIHTAAFERSAHKEITLYTDGSVDGNTADTTAGSITGSAPVQIGYTYDEYYWGHLYSIFLLKRTLDQQTISALCKLFKAC